MGILDVDEIKKHLPLRKIKRWFAYYLLEPWGQEWLRTGRQTAWLRAAMGGDADKYLEDRFLITYREGDEYRLKYEPTEEQMVQEAKKISALPGMKPKAKGRKSWPQSAKSQQSSPRAPRGS